MTRKTSKLAYKHLIEQGLLSKLKAQVYRVLYQHGPLTANEVIRIMNWNNKNTGSYTTRLSELRRNGLVEEVSKVKCPITGNQVIQWDVTNRILPISTKQSLQDKINQIDKKIIKLIERKNELLKKAQGGLF